MFTVILKLIRVSGYGNFGTLKDGSYLINRQTIVSVAETLNFV